MNELESFLEQTASALGCRGSITGFGVSRTLSVELDHRVVEVATNGPMLWLVADLDWPDFPTDGTFICWAPEPSILRTKLLEGPGFPRTTGDSEFDSTYLIHGDSSELLAALHVQVIRILMANEHLRPQLKGRAISYQTLRFQDRRHVRCEPSLSSGPRSPENVELGTERFQPEYAALWARELSAFVASLASAIRVDRPDTGS